MLCIIHSIWYVKMAQFVDRETELAFLNRILSQPRPGPAQLILLYGRRRVGKTSLILHWLGQAGLPSTYWMAEKEPAAIQRRKLYARLQNMPVRQAPLFDSWDELWAAVANLLGNQRHILVLDELPYAAEGDPAMLSALQYAWDHHFKDSQTVLVLCGSQVKAMEALQFHQSPLFGRLTGQWHVQPLPFYSLKAFFPTWAAEERVAAYAMVGGVPAYLEWLDPKLTLVENIHQVVLAPGTMFLAEPTFLLYDEVREPASFLAILKAIGAGHHTQEKISGNALINKSNLSAYLARLQELRLVERRLPALLPPAEQRRSRQGRYHLSDPYFRFYFRFLAPYLDRLPFDSEPVLSHVRRELRAFVGQTAWEELSCQWVIQQAQAGRLPFRPAVVGPHWNRRVQVDVAAVHWQEKQLLLGECKWGAERVDRQVVRELIEQKGALVKQELPGEGEGWTIHYAIFARAGVTPAAAAELRLYGGVAVDLGMLDRET